ncbi:MAG: lysophospholipid acyltransferase family protein [Bacteroidia bacterium]|nr:lysophospholipid acyltransferase family protein [Bacteroidia bacterium]
MNILNFLLYYLLIIPLSILPFKVLYLLSDFIYFLLYKVFGYRKKVVRKNLQNSFPHKTQKELIKIESEFYHHFCDIIIESIKLFTISEKQLMARVKYENRELINSFFDKKQSVIFCGGHYNNWEMLGAIIQKYIPHTAIGIYAPLNNKYFNSKFIESRTKFGLKLLAMKKVKEGFEINKNKISATFFASDQSPTYSKNIHWTIFLQQKTAVFTGAEHYAKSYNYPVIYGYINKINRGYYEFKTEIICVNPAELKKGEITEIHTRLLEKQINENPSYWLWTHNRWKRKMTESEKLWEP